MTTDAGATRLCGVAEAKRRVERASLQQQQNSEQIKKNRGIWTEEDQEQDSPARYC
jgi:hypothetical protein